MYLSLFFSPIHLAASEGHKDIVEILIRYVCVHVHVLYSQKIVIFNICIFINLFYVSTCTHEI